MGGVWFLQVAGRGWSAVGPVSERAYEALNNIVAAQSALADQDFSGSGEQFAEAGEKIAQARETLETALSVSRDLLNIVDVAGVAGTPDGILEVAWLVAQAGEKLSSGMAVLASADLKAEDYNMSVVGALESARIHFNDGRADLEEAEDVLSGTRIAWLPEKLRTPAQSLQDIIPRVRQPLASFLDQSDLLLEALGAKGEREYLLLFQNNHEIRPTGGFIGSIALVNVDRGRIENIDVQTVYDPDGQLKEFIAPPEPLRKITERWYLRDTNWFVDYPVSAQKAVEFFEKESGPTVDGVIAITPEVIRNLIAITGPIEVPGYDVTVTEDNFVELTQDQVTYSYDKQENKPKQFLADLAPLVLNRVFSVESKETLRLLGTLNEMIKQKHLLIYSRHEDEQEQIEKLGWGGSIPRGEQGFLAVNNANVGGHKSDEFVDQEIDYRSEVKVNGDVDVTVTIRRKHNGPEGVAGRVYPETENPGHKPNVVWQRVLVPDGAKLLEARGFTAGGDVAQLVESQMNGLLEADAQVTEWQRQQSVHASGTVIGKEAGYTYFANWLVTEPGSTSVAVYQYVLPGMADLPGLIHPAEKYSIFVYKQPGDMNTQIRAEIKLPDNVKAVHSVPDAGFTFTDERTGVYRGGLDENRLVGIVMEKLKL